MEIPSSDTVEQSIPARSGLLTAIPFVVVGLATLLIDQATKLGIVTFIQPGDAFPILGFFQLTHVTNTGSAFGLLQGQSTFLVMASVIGVLGVLFYYRANGRQSLALRVALGLILGGALGNLSDRLFRGAVVDFIDIQYWPGHHWPNFNVADSALLSGLMLLASYVMRQREKPGAAQPTAAVPTPVGDPDS